MSNQFHTMLEALENFWHQLLQFLPQFIVGIAVMIVGLILASVLRKGMLRILRLTKVDVAAEYAGLDEFLLKGGTKYSTINIIANLMYWVLIFGLTLAVLNSFGLDIAKDLFTSLILYMPNVIAAILILIFGTLLAKLIRGTMLTYLTNVRIDGAHFISTIIYWALIFLVVSIVLQQLSLGGQILISAFQIAFGGLCLALGIAFGLAGKEWATQILEKLWRNSR